MTLTGTSDDDTEAITAIKSLFSSAKRAPLGDLSGSEPGLKRTDSVTRSPVQTPVRFPTSNDFYAFWVFF